MISSRLVAVKSAAVAPAADESGSKISALATGGSDPNVVVRDASLFHRAKHGTLWILSTRWFQVLILLCICITSILSGIETYGRKNAMIQTLDNVVLFIFFIEVALKIFVECPKPWRYWVGEQWISNWFDFIVVVLGIFTSGDSNLLRLMRLTKLVSKIPAMQQILSGLAGGLRSAIYIIALIFLVLYIYAIVAMHVFRGNNPWHYRSLPVSILSLFRAATLVDWARIAYIDILGCDKDDFVYPKGRNTTGLEPYWYCTAPSTSYFIGPFFWSSFIIVSSLVMMSLFVGSITVAMSSSMEKLKRDELEHNKHHRLAEQVEAEYTFVDRESTVEAPSDRRRSTITVRLTHFLGLELSNLEKARAKHRLSQLLRSACGLGKTSDHENHCLLEELNQDVIQRAESPILGKYIALSIICRRITVHKRFNQFSTAVILLAGVLVGIQTDDYIIERFYLPLLLADIFVLIAFTFEIIVKVIAEGMYPFRYFFSFTRSSIKIAWWNTFDFVIVLGNYVLMANDNGGGERELLTMLRLVRLLRVMRVVRSFPELQIIVEALVTGLKSIGYIVGLLLIVIYMFGIIGTSFFGTNDPFHFRSLHVSILTLFRISTMEGWSDIMYINMYGCDRFGYDSIPEDCTNPNPSGFMAAAYFVTFVIISSLGLLTLFVSVITTSMDDSKQRQTIAKMCDERIQKMNIDGSALRSYKAAFSILDLDNSGFICEDELLVGLQSVGFDYTHEQVREMMLAVDIDCSGHIDLSEFIIIMTNEQKRRASKVLC